MNNNIISINHKKKEQIDELIDFLKEENLDSLVFAARKDDELIIGSLLKQDISEVQGDLYTVLHSLTMERLNEM